MSGEPSHDDEARARLRGKRAGLAVVIGVSLAFITASTLQITRAVFHVGVPPLPAAAAGSVDPDCAAGVKRLVDALVDESPAADRVKAACSRTSDGLELWAALERLKSAEEQLVRRDHADLSPLRHDVTAHLPADLR